MLAQNITDPALLPKDGFNWNQEEILLGFSHYDEVFDGRDIPHGKRVHELPTGRPIAAFGEDGEKEKEFEKYLIEQKVAGILILQDGKIRLERYALGFSENGRWTSQSVAKSVTSTLVGAVIEDGYIGNVDDYITDYIPGFKGSAYDSVILYHLLTMTSGVRWHESHTDMNSDLVR